MNREEIKGARIEIPAHYDLWMRGARYGVVKSTTKKGALKVRMDHPSVRRLVTISPDDLDYCRIDGAVNLYAY